MENVQITLDDEQAKQLNDAIIALQQARQLAERLHRAGVDMSDYVEQISNLDKLARGLQREFVTRQRRPSQ